MTAPAPVRIHGLGTVNGIELDAHWHLVTRIASEFRRKWRGTIAEEFYGPGWHGLMLAAERFEESKGEFAPFAKRCIRHAIINYLRSLDVVSPQVRARIQSGEVVFAIRAFTDIAAREKAAARTRDRTAEIATTRDTQEFVERDALAGLLEILTQREREILRLRFVECLTVPQIAVALDMTGEQVKYTIKRASKSLEPRARALELAA